jgi:hypothetical protein
VMDPTAGGPPPAGTFGPAVPGAHLIVPDHYQAPASRRASAHFKQGPIPGQTDGSMYTAGRPAPSGSKAGVVVAILGVLVVGAAAAAFFLRPHSDVQAPVTGSVGTEKTVETATVKPPNPGPTADPTTPPDVKSAVTAPSASAPPVGASAKPIQPGQGAKTPKGPPVAPAVTHAPVTPPVVTPPVKPPIDPLAPGGRQGSLRQPSKDRQV